MYLTAQMVLTTMTIELAMMYSVDQTMWLTMLSTAILVVVIGSAVAMLVAAENQRSEQLNQSRQRSYHQQVPSQDTSPAADSR